MGDSSTPLDVNAELTDDALVVSYELENRTDEPLFLENRLFERGAEGRRVETDLAYTRKEGDTLIVRKGRVPVPDDVDVEVPEVPYLTRVEPGASFEETFRLALPVAPNDPYAPQPAGQSTASSLVLILGIATGIQAEEVDTAGGTELWVYPTDIEDADRELRSKPISLEIPTGFAD